jgi:hypothetical protein
VVVAPLHVEHIFVANSMRRFVRHGEVSLLFPNDPVIQLGGYWAYVPWRSASLAEPENARYLYTIQEGQSCWGSVYGNSVHK